MLKTFFRPRSRPKKGVTDGATDAPRQRPQAQPSRAPEAPRKKASPPRAAVVQGHDADAAAGTPVPARGTAKYMAFVPPPPPTETAQWEEPPSGFAQRSAEEGWSSGYSRGSSWRPWSDGQARQGSTRQPTRGGVGNQNANRARRKREAASGGYRFGVPEAVESLEEMQQQLEETLEEEQRLRERLRCLEHELAQKCGRDGEDWGHRKSQLRASIDSAAAAVQDLREQRSCILRGDDPKVHEEQQAREEIKQFKASARYATEKQLDARIKELETLMLETNLQLCEERKLLGDIQRLSRLKAEVIEYRHREANLRSEEQVIRERLEETAAQLTAKARELTSAEAELKRAEQEREQALAASPEAAERASVHHQLNDCMYWKHKLQGKIEMKERILARQRAEEEEAQRREAEREEERQRRAEHQQRLRELREEREKQQQEARGRLAAATPKSVPQVRAPKPYLDELPKEPPHFAEVRLLEQTLAYCRKLLPKDDTSEKEKKEVEYNNPEGSMVIMPKEDRPEEFLFAPPKPRRHEGKVRKRPPTSKMKKTRTEGKQVLMHTPLSLQLFAELRIVPPVNTCDVPPTVDEVEERLAARRQEVAKWEEKRKELRAKWLASELEKARQAQEEREQERQHRLGEALERLEDRLRDLQEDEEASESCAEALRTSLRAAENLGASEGSLSAATGALRRWTQRSAEAALLQAMARLEEAQKAMADAAATEEAQRTVPEAAATEEEEHPGTTTSSSTMHEERSRALRAAVKDLEGSLRAARQVDVDPTQLEAARVLLEASSGKAKEEGDSTDPAELPEDEDPAESADSERGGPAQEADDFEPTILNLGSDDDEELVFDLGMG